MKKLTAKQKQFVKEYLIDLNATQAAIRAGYSKRTAAVIGFENLRKPNIQEAIQKERQRLIEKARNEGKITTPEEILEGYTRAIRFDPRKLFDEHGSPKNIPDLDDDTALELVGFDITETVVRSITGDETVIKRTYKYKQPDKHTNRDSIGRHFGMFERDNGQKRDQIIIIPDSRVNKGKGIKNEATG